MTVYQWLCLLGIPALIAGVFKYLHALIKRNTDDNKALKLGVQALLRSQMISDFNKYSEKGYAPIYARESFENCWKQYHSLGGEWGDGRSSQEILGVAHGSPG